jgi:hypothetical protein
MKKTEGATKKRPPLKCSRKAWCSSMEDRLNDFDYSSKAAKGLSVLVLMNLRTGRDLAPTGVVFRKSAKDVGLLLNVCPWCRAPIFFGKTKTAKKRGA